MILLTVGLLSIRSHLCVGIVNERNVEKAIAPEIAGPTDIGARRSK